MGTSLYEAVQILKDAKMGPGGEIALEIMHECARYVYDSEVAMVPTGDGGMTIEVEGGENLRDVMFVIPSSGVLIYFTVRGPDMRASGVVTLEDVFLFLDWVEGRSDRWRM